MKAKEIAVVAIAVIIILVVIGALFVGDATNKTLLTVGNEKYEVDDFLNYVKAWNYDNNSSKDDISSMFSQYQVYKIYSQRAKKVGLELEESEIPTIDSGDDIILLNDFAISSGDYLKVKTEIALAEKLYGSPYELGKVPKNISGDYVAYLYQNGQIDSTDMYTYDFRVIQVPVKLDEDEPEMDEPDDVSGEKSGEISGESSTEDKNEVEKAIAKEKAEKIRALVEETRGLENVEESRLDEIIDYSGDSVSGDIFTQINEKVNANRFVTTSTGIGSKGNAELDSVSTYYLESNYGESSTIRTWGLVSAELMDGISKALKGAKKDTISEIFESREGYAFVYVENVTEGLNEEDSLRLNNEAANYYIEVNANMTQNKSLISRIKVSDIIPSAKVVIEEVSGDTKAVVDEPVLEDIEPSIENEEIPTPDEPNIEDGGIPTPDETGTEDEILPEEVTSETEPTEVAE